MADVLFLLLLPVFDLAHFLHDNVRCSLYFTPSPRFQVFSCIGEDYSVSSFQKLRFSVFDVL